MNEMETQLSRLFNAAVGEPPNQVTAHAARRQAHQAPDRRLRQRDGRAGHRRIDRTGRVRERDRPAPRHQLAPRADQAEVLLHRGRTSSGSKRHHRVRGAVSRDRRDHRRGCAARGRHPQRSRCRRRRTPDFLHRLPHCLQARRLDPGPAFTGSRSSTPAGSAGSACCPAGTSSDLRGASLAVTADGSWLAIDVAKVVKGPIFRGPRDQHQDRVQALALRHLRGRRWYVRTRRDLSFAHGGQELAVFGFDTCATASDRSASDPDEEMRVVQPGRKGRPVVQRPADHHPGQLGGSEGPMSHDAFLSPDGETVIANVDGPQGRPGSSSFPPSPARSLGRCFKLGPRDTLGTIDGRFVRPVRLVDWLRFHAESGTTITAGSITESCTAASSATYGTSSAGEPG